jgi:hypothetical protein
VGGQASGQGNQVSDSNDEKDDADHKQDHPDQHVRGVLLPKLTNAQLNKRKLGKGWEMMAFVDILNFAFKNNYLFKKEGKLFHTKFFSEWIIEMDHHECG